VRKGVNRLLGTAIRWQKLDLKAVILQILRERVGVANLVVALATLSTALFAQGWLVWGKVPRVGLYIWAWEDR